MPIHPHVLPLSNKTCGLSALGIPTTTSERKKSAARRSQVASEGNTNVHQLQNVQRYHGENKNLTNSLRYFRSFYKQPIDLLFGGHLHSQSLETEGIGQYGDAQCIRVNGICGIDDYSTKLQKASRAGANMFIFKEGKGKVSQDDFWLN